MDTDNEVLNLLTEIRDNQQRQLEAHRKSQQEYFDFYNAIRAQQQRRGLIAGIVGGIAVALIIWLVSVANT